MSGVFRLVLHHLWFNRVRSAVLVACLTLPLLLPVAVHALVAHYDAALTSRAATTPAVIGARGDRFDLVLKALYFDTAYEGGVTMADVETVAERGWGRAIPLHLAHSAHRSETAAAPFARAMASAPLVGTSLAYLDFRGLAIAEGTPPLFLGDAVAGAAAARRLGLAPGDHILSDPPTAYDPSRVFQLEMPVVGILAATGGPDDEAIFVDVKTAWVIDGVGHGHDDLRTVAGEGVVDRVRSDGATLVATGALMAHQRITDDNRASFHFHGDPADYPLTAILMLPADDKQRTIAAGWYATSDSRVMLEPAAVLAELMGLVFEVKRFFDANFVVVVATTAMLVALVLFLSWRLRRREMETLHKIGCARRTVFWLQAGELMMLLCVSLALVAAGAVATLSAAPAILALPS